MTTEIREFARPFSLRNLRCTPCGVAQPTTKAELRAELEAAAAQRRALKAFGGGWGYSNAAHTGGLLVSTRNLQQVLPIPELELRPGVDAGKLLRFEAGATIEQLNAHLTPRGLALMNQPGFAKLTWVGTMQVGGHGSGMGGGPLSSDAVSLHLFTVNAQGRVLEVQLEPTHGVTDPRVFAALHPNVVLVQDDHLFNAAACSVGSVGVIYAVTVRVQPFFYICETRRRVRWSELKELLPTLLDEQGPGKRLHSIDVWLNPYPMGGDRWAMLGEREWAEGPTRGRRPMAIELGGSRVLLGAGLWWFRSFPSSVPGSLHSALGMAQARAVVLPAPEALDFGNLNQAPMVATNTALPIAGLADLLDESCEWLTQRFLAGQGFITSPLGLRFIRGSDAYLSPAWGRDSCMIEVPTLYGTPGKDALLRDHQRFMFQQGGRPHWGCLNYAAPAQLPALYPMLGRFLAARRVLDPSGFFRNPLTDSMEMA